MNPESGQAQAEFESDGFCVFRPVHFGAGVGWYFSQPLIKYFLGTNLKFEI
jgi:hypothetical protein